MTGIEMPKTRHPVADYITFDQYQKMLKDEQDRIMNLLYRYIWTFMLRVSEAVGQSESDVRQLKEHRKANKSKKKDLKWTGPLPGIRPCDIDAVSPKDAGLDCDHTLRIYRKMGKFEILPFNDKKLYNDTGDYIDVMKGPNARLFPVLRQDVLEAMQKHGRTVGGQTLIHPHALRRGGAVFLRATGRMKLEDLQKAMSHKNMGQTLDYIGIDTTTAFNNWAKVQLNTGGVA